MAIDLDILNANQRAAVEWTGGPLLVLAGPGSGKTMVITMRVAKLIEETPNQRFKILGLTFTNNAAAEMRSRVEVMVPEARERTSLSTFHAFCANILRQHGSHLGLSPDFVILNQQADREAVLIDAIRQIRSEGADAEESDIRILPLIDRLMVHDIPEDQVEDHFQDKALGWKVARLYETYKQLLISRNQVDFPSLLNGVVKLLHDKPRIAKHIRIVYKHVCVDEFHDTNFAQYRVIQAIMGDRPHDLFVVADDDQIIYQWNGASPERLRQLEEDYKMNVIQLPANYRCPPSVIELANKLIKYNIDRSPGKQALVAVKNATSGDEIRLHNFPDFKNEIEWVANDIAAKSPGERSNCAVLARTKKLLDSTMVALNQHNIPASLSTRKDEFSSAPFRWLHAILRLANTRADREQLRRLCKAFYELEGIHLEVQEIVAKASVQGGDYLQSWFILALEKEELDECTQSFLISAKKQIAERLDFLEFIKSSINWFESLNQQLVGTQQGGDGFVDYDEEKETWQRLQHDVINQYGIEEITLSILLQEFDLSPKTRPSPAGAVRCLTIHGAKGMEFEHVYLIGLAEEQLPSFQSIKKGADSRELQEERRNCFVAITRTIATLTMTYADKYFGWRKKPSRFLKEMELIN
uniref:DNA 3'-5' helicase n=1 Tax=Candidatus Methanogaster sp. ANME-2c ERB4 TaxID=2759911 RepID=A0A7G9Y1R5_9EURY|nr:ATP-dependent DNA helicase Rep [Methanosarcinales archaeon ANME-2c ERB4]QNO41949.1 ATP-dependent DNA helicase Rep [Methanosarcinales archaeon ANME-2c ERB4]QNO48279.1 ATP-dependent DNA helicase Rep [Methanosarcinales archaeon ANME-2c ERB4]